MLIAKLFFLGACPKNIAAGHARNTLLPLQQCSFFSRSRLELKRDAGVVMYYIVLLVYSFFLVFDRVRISSGVYSDVAIG